MGGGGGGKGAVLDTIPLVFNPAQKLTKMAGIDYNWDPLTAGFMSYGDSVKAGTPDMGAFTTPLFLGKDFKQQQEVKNEEGQKTLAQQKQQFDTFVTKNSPKPRPTPEAGQSLITEEA